MKPVGINSVKRPFDWSVSELTALAKLFQTDYNEFFMGDPKPPGGASGGNIFHELEDYKNLQD